MDHQQDDAAYFAATGQGGAEIFTPLPGALAGWGDQIRGMAVSGILARAVEAAVAGTAPLSAAVALPAAPLFDPQRFVGMRPARWSLELLRPAAMKPSTTSAVVVRSGRRTTVVDAELIQNGIVVARATALYVRPGETPAETVWAPESTIQPPPVSLVQTGGGRTFHSPLVGWDDRAALHQTGARTQAWFTAVTVVAGEIPTPFQFLASVSDTASMMTNWGSEGLQYINTDVSLHIARLPNGGELGMTSIHRSVSDGISVGVASLHDRDGQLGSVTVSALANGALDLAGRGIA